MLISIHSWGQEPVQKVLRVTSDTIQFDTVSVYAFGLTLKVNGQTLSPDRYAVDPIRATLVLDTALVGEEVLLRYDRAPFNFNRPLMLQSRDKIVFDTTNISEAASHSVSVPRSNTDLFGTSKLRKQGSISRGIRVGNAQSLSFQSTLNLQLDGQIGPNLYLTAAISDDNIPFQPEGNTQRLGEFDQVYLKLHNDDFDLVGGDFWLRKPQGYFLNYNKRVQGISLGGSHQMDVVGMKGRAQHRVSAALSRGKQGRSVLQAVEGNQGPYLLRGAKDEQFIIVLAGTEKVFIDGQPMKRGQAFDYTINYNTAEITFTANQLMTKDKRIIVTFQYSDLSYARSSVVYNAEFKGDRYHSWVNVYSEQDVKNQAIQQTLTTEKRAVLAAAGDQVQQAFSNSIDSVGYSDNRVLYQLKDSLGYDSVLVFSTNPNAAIYQASFQFVGTAAGNYVFDQFTAGGKVYRWVAPVDGIPQGDYAPIQLLIAPQQQQLFTFGTAYHFSEQMMSSLEIGLSNQDVNTFSALDAEDDRGLGVKWKWKGIHPLGSAQKWQLQTAADVEFIHRHFEPIQWFRTAEFDRDWNVRGKAFEGDQLSASASLSVIREQWGNVRYAVENYVWGEDYWGIRNHLSTAFQTPLLDAVVNASWLQSKGLERTDFLRHDIHLSHTIKKVVTIGVEDIHEQNRQWTAQKAPLLPTSYRFYDWKAYMRTADTVQRKMELYYRERYDWFSDSVRLKRAAKARHVGLDAQFLKHKNATASFQMDYRELTIVDTVLFASAPERTLLNRLEGVFNYWKSALTANVFYEVGSGLELKREFIFVEVNSGQGTHVWIDYNADGVKGLGEFEVAAFQDQANYIRVFIPTNDYVKTFSNQFNTSVFIRPERLWKSREGIKRWVRLFSDQVVYRISRRSRYEEHLRALNPFVYAIEDTNLVAMENAFRNTVYFNRTHPLFGAHYTYQENGSKVLLSSGFDARLHTLHHGQLRWNVGNDYNITIDLLSGEKRHRSDYAPMRNYALRYIETTPTFSYQPNPALRVGLTGRYTDKKNRSANGEHAIIRDMGIDCRYGKVQKGSFSARLNYLFISYNSAVNSSLAFEMLEGLKAGNNYTWGFTYQRKVAKSLQLNFTYNGRKSEENPVIHSGGMELRAFF